MSNKDLKGLELAETHGPDDRCIALTVRDVELSVARKRKKR